MKLVTESRVKTPASNMVPQQTRQDSRKRGFRLLRNVLGRELKVFLSLDIADLNIVVHREFVRMGALTQRSDFLIGFVPDPGIDDIFGEDIAGQQKLMVIA